MSGRIWNNRIDRKLPYRKVLWITPLFLIALLGIGMLLPTGRAAPSITTDQADYSPGQHVFITGTGFDSGPTVTVSITRPDGVSDTCNSSPRFLSLCPNTASWTVEYDLDGIFGTYLVQAPPAPSITFQDSVQVGWTQCENDHNSDGIMDNPLCFWTTGNLDAVHNLLAEGNTLPDTPPAAGSPSGQYTTIANSPGHSNQRAIMEDLPDGTFNWTIKFEWSKAGIKAYDFLTTAYGVTDSDLCSELPAGFTVPTCTGIVGAGVYSASFPLDTTTAVGTKTGDIEDRQTAHTNAFTLGVGSKAGLPASEVRKMKMYGLGAGSITSITNGGLDGSPSGDSDYFVSVIFSKSTGGNSDVVGLWGGHFAIGDLAPAGWGTGNGAGSISGAPFHMILDSLTQFKVSGAQNKVFTGSRDNQVSVSTVLSVTVTCPGGTNGKPITCTASANGGVPPYTFEWSAPGGSPSSGTGSTFTTTYASPGTYVITVKLTDSRGVSAQTSIIVVVTPQPKVLTASCSDGTAGKPISCSASSAGGVPPITFFWTAPGGSPSGGSGPLFSTTFAVKGTYTIIVEQFDNGVHTGTKSMTVVVAPQPLVVEVSCAGGTAGKPFNCDVSASGGTTPYSGTGSFSVSFPVKGSYPVSFTVTDANGASATGSTSVLVTQQPFVVTVDCPDSDLTAGKPFSCTVSASGGTAPYSGTGSFSVTLPVKGVYSVSFDVTDSNGKSATGSDTVDIVQQPFVATVSCHDGTAGKPFECIVSASGGTAPYAGTGVFTVTIPVKGTYTVSFAVTDANGKTATGSDSVAITQQPFVVRVDCPDFGLTAGKPFVCTVSASGGTAPYTGTGSFTVLEPVKGTYTEAFSVRDSNGKTATGSDSVIIVQQPLVVSVDCDDGTAGKPFECRVSANGGTAPYVGTGSFSVTLPVKGEYTVSFDVSDANGKSATGSDAVAIAQQPFVARVDCPDLGLTAGKPFSCTVSASGGTAPYSGTGSFSVTIPVKGSYTVSFGVSDSNGKTATGSDTVVILQQPFVATVVCQDGTAGKPFECTVSASGGTAPYAGTGVFTVTIPVKGTYTVSFDVTDANGKSTTASDSVSVTQQPFVVRVDCPNAGLTAGKPFTCTVSASGGTAPYTGTGDFTVSIPVKGSYTVSFDARDANGKSATGFDSVVIVQQPLVVTVDCDDGTAGKPFECKVSASGGTAPYVGTGIFTVTLPVKGTYAVSFDVSDANGKSATGSDSVAITQQPFVVRVDCPDFGLTAGKPFVCTVSASGGTAPYTGTGDFTVSIPVKGSYTVSFDARDANGKAATGSDSVVIIQQPFVVSVDCDDGTAGKPFECRVSASGGTAPYAATGSFTVTLPVKGTYTVSFSVSDANGKVATGSDSVTIQQQPFIVSVDCDDGTAGKPFECRVSATGGTAPYSGTGSFTRVEPVKGAYTETFDVRDANGKVATGSDSVNIRQQPLVITGSCATGATAGKPLQCDASASGGTAPYSFSWDVGKDGIIDGSGPKFTTTFPVKGPYSIDAIVRDANQKTAFVNIPVTILPQPLMVVRASCDSTGTAGKPVTCIGEATGGTAPYAFFWDIGKDGTIDGSGATFVTSFAVKGTYSIDEIVVDVNQDRATTNFVVIIGPQPFIVTVGCDDGSAGKPFECRVSAEGGTVPYVGTGSFTVTIPVKGTYTVSFDARDANGVSATGSDIVQVAQQPLIVTVDCDDGTAGKPFECRVSATGGTAPYAGTGSFTVVEPVKGTFTETFSVHDANGKLATGSDTVVITQQPFIVTVDCPADGLTAGKPFDCSVSATGGTAPYAGTGSFTVTEPVKGTYTESFVVRDANGKFATGSDSVLIRQQPLIVTVDCDDGTAGKPFECRVSASGGTAPYGGTGSFSVTLPVKGSYAVSFDVTDANGKTATGSDSVLIRQQPFIVSVDCDDGTAGKPFECRVSATGGTVPYSGTGAFTVTIPVKGTYTVSFDVMDANGKQATGYDTVNIRQQPVVVSVDCDDGTAGKPFECRVSASGGTAPYSGTGSFTVTLPVKGTYTVSFDVTDANGKNATGSDSVSIAQQPLLVTVDCDDGTAGKPFECRVSASGGTAPYSGTGVFTVTIPVKGTYTVSFDVRDANGKVASGSDTVLVTQQPLIVTVDCDDLVTAGKPFECRVSATGGTAPYAGTGSYTTTIPVKGTFLIGFPVTDANGKDSFGADSVLVQQQPLVVTVDCNDGTAGKPLICIVSASGGTSPYQGTGNFTVTIPVKGTYTVTFDVRDSNGKVVTGSDAVLIRQQPLVVTVDCDDATAGKPFQCRVSASGGTAPYTGTGTFTVVEPVKGTYTESFTVGDANGKSVTGSDTVVVRQQPLTVSVDCQNGSLTAGKPYDCSVSATGGTAPYTGTGIFTRTRPSKGTYSETFNITDANGKIATGSDTVVIAPQPMVASFSSVCIGSTGSVQFTASVSGGTTPYIFSWNFGDGNTGTGNPVSHTYSPAGVFNVVLTVTDANNARVTVKHSIVACGIGFTDTSFCFFDVDPNRAGQQFRLIFVQDPQNMSTYKLVASNPGQFYDNVFYTGTVGSKATLTITLPFPFVTQGAVPIQVHDSVSLTSSGCFIPGPNINSQFTITTLGGQVSASGSPIVVLSDYSPQTFGSTTSITVQGFVPATGLIYVTVHLDYGLKGQVGYQKGEAGNVADTLDAIDTTLPVATVLNFQSYTFTVGGSLVSSTSVESENVFKRDPGFAGVVLNSSATPMQGVRVEIWSPMGKLMATVYTDVNGFYSYQYKHTGKAAYYTVRLPDYGTQQTALLSSNKVVLVNFALTI